MFTQNIVIWRESREQLEDRMSRELETDGKVKMQGVDVVKVDEMDNSNQPSKSTDSRQKR